MIALDTNVVVRYLVQDDPRQSAVATRLLEKSLHADNRGFISLIALCEIAWVLEDCYQADRKEIHKVIEALLGTKQLEVESAERAWRALRAWDASTADFSDAIIGQVAQAHGAGRIVTFDKSAARLPGFELLT